MGKVKKKGKYNQIKIQGGNNQDGVKPGMKPIIITQTRRGGLDVGDYMGSLKAAENVDKPNRAKLIDIM